MNSKPSCQSVLVCKYPAGAISVTVRAAPATSIFIEWTVVDGVDLTGFTVSFSNTDSTDCFTDTNTTTIIDGSIRSYNIEGLQEGTEYTIIVSLLRGDEATDEDTVTQVTYDARKTLKSINSCMIACIPCSSICCSL